MGADHSRELARLLELLVRTGGELVENTIGPNTTATAADTALAAKRYAEVVESLVKLRATLASLEPPEPELLEIREATLAAIDEQLEAAKRHHETLLQVCADPLAYAGEAREITIRLSLGGPRTERLSEVLESVKKKLGLNSGPAAEQSGPCPSCQRRWGKDKSSYGLCSECEGEGLGALVEPDFVGGALIHLCPKDIAQNLFGVEREICEKCTGTGKCSECEGSGRV